MKDQSFRSLLRDLESRDELIRFTKPVHPDHNMAAVEWRAFDELGKASLFTNIEGHPDWTACSQIIADRRKWSIGLGIPEDRLLEEILRRIREPVAPVPVAAAQAPVKEIKLIGEKASLLDLPAMKVSERDAGRFIAAGISFVKDPETGIGNLSFHRQQIKGRDTSGFVMLPRHARHIYDKYSALGKGMPVAIVLGVHPAISLACGFSTSFGLDELTIAGAILGEPIRTVKCETVDLDVPAEAEIVLEGEILPGNHMETEGPFGEVTGSYPEVGKAHVFKLKAITRRRDAIFYAIHCGFPATDTQSITGLGIEVATFEHLRKVDGGLDLIDLRCLTISGLMMLVLKMRPRTAGQAKVALMAALTGPYQQPKVAIAVDDDIDSSDLRQIMWSIATRVHAEQDVVMMPNMKVWALDNASPVVAGVETYQRIGTRWMIDATKPPVTMPSDRARFDKAMPPGYHAVNLKDYLP